jgi:transposase-like protein
MSTRSSDSHGYRFPPEIVSTAVWRSHRFSLSFHDVKELLSEYGVTVGYEAVRLWCLQCAPSFAKKLRHNRLSDNVDGRYDPEAQDTRRHA